MQPVNDPQIWTLIGVFAAVMLGGMTLTTTLLMRTITASIGGLRGEMNGRFDGLRGEMNGLRGEMNARFDAVETKIEHLDRDVAALTRKVWGETER
ncbi:hypothetical protein [Protaetiibacter intestinalis]|uniref:Uncharacterized protein n=1 Tax=Protaetiibacter intestinalis TaxID=2419774 RepID=A0A387B833_9MICO|nr:hypothetical protein [Protaetiibacter intestinalis]AYF97256.1 hypothetical protein D7I47_02655 [Protaetiibacter intestinalis]